MRAFWLNGVARGKEFASVMTETFSNPAFSIHTQHVIMAEVYASEIASSTGT